MGNGCRGFPVAVGYIRQNMVGRCNCYYSKRHMYILQEEDGEIIVRTTKTGK
jgi:hypothetical protein